MAVKLALAGFLIPYIFCYNPGLLMIGATGWEVLFYASTAALGIASLSFASVGYWRRDLYWWGTSDSAGGRHHPDHPRRHHGCHRLRSSGRDLYQPEDVDQGPGGQGR